MSLAGRGHDLGRRRLPRRERRFERVAAREHRRHDVRGRRPPPRLLLEAAQDRPLDRRVEPGHERRRLDRPLVAVLARVLRERLALEGAPARVELVEHEAERVDVAADRDLAPLQLLRRHVAGRPRAHVVVAQRLGEAGQAEVGDAHVALAVEHHVRGLEVPVQHALLVRRGEARAELPRDLERLVRRQPPDPAQQRGEVLAVHELHRDEEVALRLGHVVDAAHGRVRHVARDAHLAVEAREPLAVAVEAVRQELERDRLLELEVVGAVDLAHPAAAQQADDPVAPGEHCPGYEPLAGQPPPAVRGRARLLAGGRRPRRRGVRRGAGRALGDVEAGSACRTGGLGTGDGRGAGGTREHGALEALQREYVK